MLHDRRFRSLVKMNMWTDRTVAREPVRYTAATMEMMRLEDLHHTKCGVNYAMDHSHGIVVSVAC